MPCYDDPGRPQRWSLDDEEEGDPIARMVADLLRESRADLRYARSGCCRPGAGAGI